MTTTYFEHEGPYPNAHSNLSPALRFLANYTARVDSADFNCSWLPYFHPNAVFHDATGIDYVGGANIWKMMTGLFGSFDKIYMETTHSLVITRPDGTHEMFLEWYAHFWPKGQGEEGKISIPRAMVFKLGKAEGDGTEGEGEVGFEGLQILEVRLYFDRSKLVAALQKPEGAN